MKEKPKESNKEDILVDERGYAEIERIGVYTEIFWNDILKKNYDLKVFCDDSESLVKLTFEKRGLKPEDCDIHCGFDGGQGFLKIGFTVTDKNNNNNSKVFFH